MVVSDFATTVWLILSSHVPHMRYWVPHIRYTYTSYEVQVYLILCTDVPHIMYPNLTDFHNMSVSQLLKGILKKIFQAQVYLG